MAVAQRLIRRSIALTQAVPLSEEGYSARIGSSRNRRPNHLESPPSPTPRARAFPPAPRPIKPGLGLYTERGGGANRVAIDREAGPLPSSTARASPSPPRRFLARKTGGASVPGACFVRLSTSFASCRLLAALRSLWWLGFISSRGTVDAPAPSSTGSRTSAEGVKAAARSEGLAMASRLRGHDGACVGSWSSLGSGRGARCLQRNPYPGAPPLATWSAPADARQPCPAER